MDYNTKRDVIDAWNQIEEVNTDFNELTDAELILYKDTIQKRIKLAMALLGNHFTDKELKLNWKTQVQ